jgi:hypothetical protein
MRWCSSRIGQLLKSFFFGVSFVSLLNSHVMGACEKKGIGLGRIMFSSPHEYIKEMNAHWYYDWTPFPSKDVQETPFVPMVNGIAFRVQSDLQALAAHSPPPILLGFNEPDFDVTNMTVDQAIAIWPQLQQRGQRIGSPAVSNFESSWLPAFMAQVREKHLRVDFIAIHYYGPADAQGFLEGVDRIHEQYGLPIWITEFAVKEKIKYANHPHYTPDDVLRFLQIVLPGLESRPYVERFAWWGLGVANPEALKSSRFFEDDGSLTEVGRYYASIEANENGPVCGQP